ncbi:hypothetical protein [Candidatus Scalindua japonica]|uniref:hypothetical protein n=1 Tax=Candidatus Scalindua japonica TaxID=1284222 RepID=UPI000BDF4609|nr:hypothetical protein [Candidatus Scalindua japonica]
MKIKANNTPIRELKIQTVKKRKSPLDFQHNLRKTKHLKPDRKIDKLILLYCSFFVTRYLSIKSTDHFGAHSSVG